MTSRCANPPVLCVDPDIPVQNFSVEFPTVVGSPENSYTQNTNTDNNPPVDELGNSLSVDFRWMAEPGVQRKTIYNRNATNAIVLNFAGWSSPTSEGGIGFEWYDTTFPITIPAGGSVTLKAYWGGGGMIHGEPYTIAPSSTLHPDNSWYPEIWGRTANNLYPANSAAHPILPSGILQSANSVGTYAIGSASPVAYPSYAIGIHGGYASTYSNGLYLYTPLVELSLVNPYYSYQPFMLSVMTQRGFCRGTKIRMSDGTTKNIEALEAGDVVWSCSPKKDGTFTTSTLIVERVVGLMFAAYECHYNYEHPLFNYYDTDVSGNRVCPMPLSAYRYDYIDGVGAVMAGNFLCFGNLNHIDDSYCVSGNWHSARDAKWYPIKWDGTRTIDVDAGAHTPGVSGGHYKYPTGLTNPHAIADYARYDIILKTDLHLDYVNLRLFNPTVSATLHGAGYICADDYIYLSWLNAIDQGETLELP